MERKLPGRILKKKKCKHCGKPMTFRDQRAQFARLIHIGKTPEEIKPLLPRCQKCVTKMIESAREDF